MTDISKLTVEQVMEAIHSRGFMCVKVHCHQGDFEALAYNVDSGRTIKVSGESFMECIDKLNKETEQAWNKVGKSKPMVH